MLQKILIGLGALVLLVLMGPLALLQNVHVERSVMIDASPEQIFPHLNDFRAFNEWSPWASIDPDATYEFSGAASGVGARFEWSGNDDVGTGSQEITLSEPYSRIELTLEFGEGPPADVYYTLTASDEGTEIVWALDTDMGYFGRYFGFMMEPMIGGNYEDGLASLKTIVENGSSMPAAVFHPNEDMNSNDMGSAPAMAGEDDKPGDEEKPEEK